MLLLKSTLNTFFGDSVSVVKPVEDLFPLFFLAAGSVRFSFKNDGEDLMITTSFSK